MFLPSDSKLCIPAVLIAVVFLLSHVHVQAGGDSSHSSHSHDVESDEDYSTITCGSSIKLVHRPSSYKLHSHQIKWGSGSGQQSVTGFQNSDDANSLWTIRESYGSSMLSCPIGTPVNCSSIVRLQHTKTRNYLHSHLHSSPLSRRQEVSCYGDDSGSGTVSDTGDNWKVICLTSGATEWKTDESIVLEHVDTGKKLYTRRADAFDHNNCRGCPIVGQLEISAFSTSNTDVSAQWKVGDGIFAPQRRQLQMQTETQSD